MNNEESERNIGQEILNGIKEVKAGKGRSYTVSSFAYIKVREKTGLSQSQFAELLSVSIRTQDWEQGRREPSGAAKTLLKVAEHYPKVLLELAA